NVIGRVDDPASLGARIVFGERPQPCGGKPADQHHDLHPLLPISHASSWAGFGPLPPSGEPGIPGHYTAVTDLAVQASAIRLHSPLDGTRLRRVSSQGSLVRLWALQASNLRPPPCKSATPRVVASRQVTCSALTCAFTIPMRWAVTPFPAT